MAFFRIEPVSAFVVPFRVNHFSVFLSEGNHTSPAVACLDYLTEDQARAIAAIINQEAAPVALVAE